MTPMAERVDAAYQKVTCSGCGKKYVCTPDEDYYNSTTLDDGVCWDCLLEQGGLKPQPEPPYQ